MLSFKRISIAGKGYDAELTIKDTEIVNFLNRFDNQTLTYTYHETIQGLIEVLLKLEKEDYDPRLDAINKKITTYLAGPMESAKDNGTRWRYKITKELEKLDIEILNPCKIETELTGFSLNENMRLVTEAKKNKDFEMLKKIMIDAQDRDYSCIDNSSFMIVYLDHKSGPGGTYAEIEYARTIGIPVYGLCTGNLIDENSWMLTTILRTGGHIFSTYKELVDYIDNNWFKHE